MIYCVDIKLIKYYSWYERDTARLNSALLHSTLGQCEEISDCSYTGQTFLQKRNINNVSQLDQGTTAQEDLEAGSDQDQENSPGQRRRCCNIL